MLEKLMREKNDERRLSILPQQLHEANEFVLFSEAISCDNFELRSQLFERGQMPDQVQGVGAKAD